MNIFPPDARIGPSKYDLLLIHRLARPLGCILLRSRFREYGHTPFANSRDRSAPRDCARCWFEKAAVRGGVGETRSINYDLPISVTDVYRGPARPFALRGGVLIICHVTAPFPFDEGTVCARRRQRHWRERLLCGNGDVPELSTDLSIVDSFRGHLATVDFLHTRSTRSCRRACVGNNCRQITNELSYLIRAFQNTSTRAVYKSPALVTEGNILKFKPNPPSFEVSFGQAAGLCGLKSRPRCVLVAVLSSKVTLRSPLSLLKGESRRTRLIEMTRLEICLKIPYAVILRYGIY
ncbi:hypothetical protein EVAR_59847_1 [Eumeta japonica]|uniref:Uncharacterized protein n=1 Tax=Eumeta variegata TaxID=151549 RepID=A0A4C1Z4P2_EUMVA|nr:hypothetical protein EVAR_59847_1 [Eumeta japonica]